MEGRLCCSPEGVGWNKLAHSLHAIGFVGVVAVLQAQGGEIRHTRLMVRRLGPQRVMHAQKPKHADPIRRIILFQRAGCLLVCQVQSNERLVQAVLKHHQHHQHHRNPVCSDAPCPQLSWALSFPPLTSQV